MIFEMFVNLCYSNFHYASNESNEVNFFFSIMSLNEFDFDRICEISSRSFNILVLAKSNDEY